LQAAQREVRHRLALGQFAPGDPTPEQLLDAALQHAWRERRRLPPALGVKAWALASIFRTGEALGWRLDCHSLKYCKGIITPASGTRGAGKLILSPMLRRAFFEQIAECLL
jgi:hypothetical protein